MKFSKRGRLWNQCQVCGKFIGFADLENGTAINRFVDYSEFDEVYSTLCRICYLPERYKKRFGQYPDDDLLISLTKRSK